MRNADNGAEKSGRSKMRDRIIIIGPIYYANPFYRLGEVTRELDILLDAPNRVKLVVFTGGEDIHPSLYGGKDDFGLCFSNMKRDIYERNVFKFCRKHNVKMTGICRGFQLLNVMAGGFMYHHLNKHGLVGFHNAYFPHIDNTLQVTSTHHQLVGLTGGSLPIAWAQPSRSSIYVGPNGEEDMIPAHEIEAAVFPNINAMGVQYHPEMMWDSYKGRAHYVKMVGDFINLDMKEFIERYTKGRKNGRSRQGKNRRKALRRSSRG